MSRKRILIQAGHAPPRPPGKLQGQTGTPGEIDFTLTLRTALKNLIANDSRLEGVYVPGDIPNGVKCDAALFLHADGSTNKARSGYCFGYPQVAVNKRLADLIASEFDKIPRHPHRGKDNYTDNLSEYYGYSRVKTAGPEVLVEHGFLTNPGERAWLQMNIEELAAAEYRAILRYFYLPLPEPPDTWKPGDPIWKGLLAFWPQPRPARLPDGVYPVIDEVMRRTRLIDKEEP